MSYTRFARVPPRLGAWTRTSRKPHASAQSWHTQWDGDYVSPRRAHRVPPPPLPHLPRSGIDWRGTKIRFHEHMRRRVFHNSRRELVTRFLLVILLFRAYVPVGFMPASGTPFLLEICPAGVSAPMDAHYAHHHSGSHVEFVNCPFGSAPAAGPLSHVIDFDPPAPIVSQSVVPFEPLLRGVRLQRAHQPRGPPSLA
ncbi:MAG: hypothetical protein JWN43_5055 [Gammaproteobacteria bacterium]|nr:hypothetical protein [Gammaproteobacteria bacterium]